MSSSACSPTSYVRFKIEFLASRFADRTSDELFDLLCHRLEHLANLPNSFGTAQMEEFKILSFLQPWALESRDNFFVFDKAVRLIPANTHTSSRNFQSLTACLSFIQEIQQLPYSF
jgi:hypothetical protein